MCLIHYQPWQYCCYWDEKAREIWAEPSEDCLQSLVQITQVALAALACLFTFTFEWMLVGFSLACGYPVEVTALPALAEEVAPRVIELDEFHGLVDVHAPDGVPDAWLIERMNVIPYANPPGDLDRCTFFRDAMKEALGFLAPNLKAHYVDLFRHDGIPEEGEASVEIYNYCASCLVAHDCRYPTALRDEDPIYADFQGLSAFDKALVLLRLIAPEKEWRLSRFVRTLVQHIQVKAHNMSQDQIFLRQVMAPVVANPELYPLEQ